MASPALNIPAFLSSGFSRCLHTSVLRQHGTQIFRAPSGGQVGHGTLRDPSETFSVDSDLSVCAKSSVISDFDIGSG